MKKTGKTTMWLMALGLGVTLPLAAMAAPGGGPGSEDGTGFRQGRGEHRERLQEMHTRLLKEKVGLDDARVAKVQAVTQQFRTQSKAVYEDVSAAQESLRILVEANSTDDQAYTKAIAQVRTSRAKLQSLRQDERDAVAKLLSPKEHATLMVTMQKVRKHHGLRGRGGEREKRGERGGRGFGPRGGGSAFDGAGE